MNRGAVRRLPALAAAASIFCLALAASPAAGQAAPTGDPVGSLELLRDPRWTLGLRPPVNGANRDGPGADCLQRWQAALPSTADACWYLVTVEEADRLCDNLDTPAVDGDQVVYASAGGSKRLELRRGAGELLIVYDTEREWRRGCDLSLPDDGAQPRYLRGQAWNWPHLLLSQDLRDPRTAEGRLRLSDYREATLTLRMQLLASEKGSPAQCPPDSWGGQMIPDHCLLYVALVLVRDASAATPAAAGTLPPRIYALYPLFYSHGGERDDRADGAWLGHDPGQDAVYFTANRVPLEVGADRVVSIDARALAAEAVAAVQAGFGPEAYAVEGLLLGWEIWGAYRTLLRLGELSFQTR